MNIKEKKRIIIMQNDTIRYCSESGRIAGYLLDHAGNEEQANRDRILGIPGHTEGELTLPPDLNEGHPEMYTRTLAIVLLSAGAFMATSFASFPLSSSIQIFALEVLSVVGLAIVNNQLACRQSIEYFTVGHISQHKRLLQTDNPTLNGLVWGIYSSTSGAVIAGLATAAIATITRVATLESFVPTLALFNTVIMGGICLQAHLRAMQCLRKRKAEDDSRKFAGCVILPKETYHPVLLYSIPKEKRAAYTATGVRNLTSVRSMIVYTAIKTAAITLVGAATNMWVGLTTVGLAAIGLGTAWYRRAAALSAAN